MSDPSWEVGADCSEKGLDTLSIVCAELVAIHSCGTLVVCTKEFGSKWGNWHDVWWCNRASNCSFSVF